MPAASFCEYVDSKPRKTPAYFATSPARPLFAFAATLGQWHGVRGTKANPAEGDHRLHGFLAIEANANDFNIIELELVGEEGLEPSKA